MVGWLGAVIAASSLTTTNDSSNEHSNNHALRYYSKKIDPDEEKGIPERKGYKFLTNLRRHTHNFLGRRFLPKAEKKLEELIKLQQEGREDRISKKDVKKISTILLRYASPFQEFDLWRYEEQLVTLINTSNDFYKSIIPIIDKEIKRRIREFVDDQKAEGWRRDWNILKSLRPEESWIGSFGHDLAEKAGDLEKMVEYDAYNLHYCNAVDMIKQTKNPLLAIPTIKEFNKQKCYGAYDTFLQGITELFKKGELESSDGIKKVVKEIMKGHHNREDRCSLAESITKLLVSANLYKEAERYAIMEGRLDFRPGRITSLECAYTKAGNCLQAVKSYKKAIRRYKKAIFFSRSNERAHNAFAVQFRDYYKIVECALGAGKPKLALHFIEKCRRKKGDSGFTRLAFINKDLIISLCKSKGYMVGKNQYGHLNSWGYYEGTGLKIGFGPSAIIINPVTIIELCNQRGDLTEEKLYDVGIKKALRFGRIGLAQRLLLDAACSEELRRKYEKVNFEDYKWN